MVIPRVFSNEREKIIASFNFVDIADGTGIISFFGAKSSNSAEDKNILTTISLFSQDISTVGADTASDSGNFTKGIDLDFDVVLNLPRNLKGNARFNVTSHITQKTGGNAVQQYLIFKIRKWDGSTETEIASVQTATHIPAATEGIKEFLTDVEIPLTHFKAGETLRVTVEGWGLTGVGTDDYAISIANDPVARNSTKFPSDDAYTTTAKFLIPFKIDL